jgi:hypothetical protein
MLTEPVTSEASFRDAVLAGVEQACALRLSELTFCDPHFGFWPLSEAPVLSALSAFVKLPGRRLVLLAQRYDHLRRRHPRFVRWRNDWSHAVSPLRLQSHQADLPALLLAGRTHGLLLKNPEGWSGGWVTDRADLWALIEQAEGWRREAEPDLSVSVTGL